MLVSSSIGAQERPVSILSLSAEEEATALEEPLESLTRISVKPRNDVLTKDREVRFDTFPEALSISRDVWDVTMVPEYLRTYIDLNRRLGQPLPSVLLREPSWRRTLIGAPRGARLWGRPASAVTGSAIAPTALEPPRPFVPGALVSASITTTPMETLRNTPLTHLGLRAARIYIDVPRLTLTPSTVPIRGQVFPATSYDLTD